MIQTIHYDPPHDFVEKGAMCSMVEGLLPQQARHRSSSPLPPRAGEE
jgi:hypothetical protein